MIYLDHAATTPTDPAVVEAMLPYFTSSFGNPSSVYRLGTLSLEAINRSREIVANVLGAARNEVVFTSGASEAINLAIKGTALAARERKRGNHVVTTATEHHATLHAVEALGRIGFDTTIVAVDRTGRVDVAAIEAAIRADTVLVSVIYGNNEIGTVNPVVEIGALCRRRDIAFHVDAVQAVGALPLDVNDLSADLLSMSGHKFYGPKGVGALFVRHGLPMQAIIDGGGQEQRRRAGTENVPGIVGFATALQLAVDEQPTRVEICRRLRDRLIAGVVASLADVTLNGHPTERLPSNAHFTFGSIEGDRTTESLLVLLDQREICASTGSACNTRAIEPSHVLRAIGLSDAAAHSSLRFTVGWRNTSAEIEHVLAVLPDVIQRRRRVSGSVRNPTRPDMA
jgi:cysteine desulfurase